MTDIAPVVSKIEALLQEPVFFRDVLAALRDCPYRVILRAWSDVRMRHTLARDELGRYWVERM
ncbi:MAG TPA: hypothetical protein VFL51_07550 [Pseudolabrys sp.]|nr:hypothetical protein [Pseudolabrys sp.]